MKKTLAQYLFAGILGLAGGYLVFAVLSGERVGEAGQAQAGAEILAANFPDVKGIAQPLAQWKGKVMVVNFWATWCGPCREEMPMFVKVQGAYKDRGVVFVGVAIDQADKVENFVKEIGVNYPVVVAESEGAALSRKAGNSLGGLPFTVILDRNGRAVDTHFGAFDESKLKQAISPLI